MPGISQSSREQEIKGAVLRKFQLIYLYVFVNSLSWALHWLMDALLTQLREGARVFSLRSLQTIHRNKSSRSGGETRSNSSNSSVYTCRRTLMAAGGDCPGVVSVKGVEEAGP